GIVTRTRVTIRLQRMPPPAPSWPVGFDLEDLPLDLAPEFGEALDIVRGYLSLRGDQRGVEVRPRVEPEVGDLIELVSSRALRHGDRADPRPLLNRGQMGFPVVAVEGRRICRLPGVHDRELHHRHCPFQPPGPGQTGDVPREILRPSVARAKWVGSTPGRR